MNVGAMLLMMCAVCAMIGIYRGLMNRREKRSKVASPHISAVRVPHRAPPRIVWLDAIELLKLTNSDPDTVVFRLMDGSGPIGNLRLVNGEQAVTLQEFKDTLPWIPPQSRIALYRVGGIDGAIARRIGAIAPGRELLLVSGRVPHLVEDEVSAGGRL